MSIQIDAKCMVNNINNIMKLQSWYHSIYFSYNDVSYKFIQKHYSNIYKINGELVPDKNVFDDLEEQFTNIKFYRFYNYFHMEFINSYQECIKELALFFNTIKVKDLCQPLSDMINETSDINIDNMCEHIKHNDIDVDYDSYTYQIPESERDVHMYYEIEFSDNEVGRDEFLIIRCDSADVIINGCCYSEEYRTIIKNFCEDLQNFTDIGDRSLDEILSSNHFQFGNNGGHEKMTDINILQKYLVIFRNYYPSLEITSMRACVKVKQTISINRNLICKSAANYV